MKTMLATLLLLVSTGCTVEVKPQVLPNVRLPWQKPVPPPKPWWKPGVELVTLRKPAKPAEAPAVSVPEPAKPEPKPTAAIHGSGRSQYIIRNGLKHFWNGKHGDEARWVASYRSCGSSGCSTRVSRIKPGE